MGVLGDVNEDGEGALGAVRIGEGDLETVAGNGDLEGEAEGGVRLLKVDGAEKFRSRSRKRLSPLAVGSSASSVGEAVPSSTEGLGGFRGT